MTKNTTRRLLTAIVALGLVVSATGSARADAQSYRTIYGRYRPYPAPATGCNKVLGSWACMIVQPLPTEQFVRVKVTDAHGLPVYFFVYNPHTGYAADFCGKTKMPLPLDQLRYMEIEVGVSRWVAQTKCPASAVKTRGTIRVTLSNNP